MHKPFREIALPLLAAGYSPIPIVPETKRPALAAWQQVEVGHVPDIRRYVTCDLDGSTISSSTSTHRHQRGGG